VKHRVKNEWYLVILTKTRSFSSGDLAAIIRGGDSALPTDLCQDLSMNINVILKVMIMYTCLTNSVALVYCSAHINHFPHSINKFICLWLGMIALTPNSPSLLFPLQEQPGLFCNGMIETDQNKKCLLSGTKQVAVVSSTGVHIQSDPIVNWFDKERVSKSKVKVIPGCL
jgi:hypothetical protein